MVYESKAAGALLELGEPFLATFPKDARYQTYVALVEQMKSGARDVYAGLVKSMAETSLYSKSDILVMAKGALNALPSYHPILTDQDRQNLTGTLEKQISAMPDQQVKTELTALRDAIKHSQVPT
jgi:hypothetical protein